MTKKTLLTLTRGHPGQLEALEKEITSQKQRVQRARQARDAAEAASQQPSNSPTE